MRDEVTDSISAPNRLGAGRDAERHWAVKFGVVAAIEIGVCPGRMPILFVEDMQLFQYDGSVQRKVKPALSSAESHIW